MSTELALVLESLTAKADDSLAAWRTSRSSGSFAIADFVSRRSRV